MSADRSVEVSIVLPCLNEARTVAVCVRDGLAALDAMHVTGEVIVADNGSSDGSQQLARDAGARVVEVPVRGYGAAITAGCRSARGRFLVIADADGSYDLGEIGPFIEQLRDGKDLVMGSRFRGRIERGAMPWKNRYIGNPLLSGMLRVLFRAPDISDAHSGLRALKKDAFDALNLRTPGMEFASEMVVRACKLSLAIGEVPVTLRPDGRDRAPHLRPWRDGWRHLKFMLMFAPGALFLLPGVVLFGAGTVLLLTQLFAPANGPLRIGDLRLDFHWAVIGSLLCVVGYQVVSAYFMARIYSVTHDLRNDDPVLERAFGHVTLERALVLGTLVLLVGAGVLAYVVFVWVDHEFGRLATRSTREVIVGSTLIAGGVQTLSNAFVFSIIGDRYRRRLTGLEAAADADES